jgi:hypothetical protein
VAFLPEDRASFEVALKRIVKSKAVVNTHFARLSDFDAIFDAILGVKERKGVVNSALAPLVMAELALERLAQLDPAADADAA